MKTVITTMISGCLLLASCGNTQTTKVDYTQERVAVDTHNARNSLDYAGTYKGTIPCADCPGIEITVTLNGNGTYTKTMTYTGKEPNNAFTTQGRYEWNQQGDKIKFMSESDPDIYRVEENRIVMLDQDGNRITGNFAEMYLLQKQ